MISVQQAEGEKSDNDETVETNHVSPAIISASLGIRNYFESDLRGDLIALPSGVTKTDPKKTTLYKCFEKVGYSPTEQELMMLCTVVSSETGYCEDKAQKAVAHDSGWRT